MHHSDITSWLCKLRSYSEWMATQNKYEHVVIRISAVAWMEILMFYYMYNIQNLTGISLITYPPTTP